MERLDDLQHNGLMLYQDTDYVRFNADALWLCSFLRLNQKDTVVELGSGTGVISILGADNTKARFIGVERQQRLVDSRKKARRTIIRRFTFSARMQPRRPRFSAVARFPQP